MKRFELAASVYLAALTLGLTAHAADDQKEKPSLTPKSSLYCATGLATAANWHTLKTIQDMNSVRELSQSERAKLLAVLSKFNLRESDLKNPARHEFVMARLNNAAARIKILDDKMTSLENAANAETKKTFFWSKPENAGRTPSLKSVSFLGIHDSEYAKHLNEKRDLNTLLSWLETPDSKTGRPALAIRTKEQQAETFKKLMFQSQWADDLLAQSKVAAKTLPKPTGAQLAANAQKVLFKQPLEGVKGFMTGNLKIGPAEAGRILGFCGKLAVNVWAAREAKDYVDQITAIFFPKTQAINAQVGMPIVPKQAAPAKTAAVVTPAAPTKPVAATLEQRQAHVTPPLKEPIKTVETVEVEPTPAASDSGHVSTADGTLPVAKPTQEDLQRDFFTSVDTSKDTTTNPENPTGLTN